MLPELDLGRRQQQVPILARLLARLVRRQRLDAGIGAGLRVEREHPFQVPIVVIARSSLIRCRLSLARRDDALLEHGEGEDKPEAFVWWPKSGLSVKRQ